MNPGSAQTAWCHDSVIRYYEEHRHTTSHVYPSEWCFLKELLEENMSILDIGCALGGFASITGEHLGRFMYTGVDISPAMIRRARERHPAHAFHCIEEADLSVLRQHTYDLVLCMGILHLSKTWRELIQAAWRHTKRHLLMDLRESTSPTIEGEGKSYMRVANLDLSNSDGSRWRLPYIIVNHTEALGTVMSLCQGMRSLRYYGYLHAVSQEAVCPVKQVMMNVYCIEKEGRP